MWKLYRHKMNIKTLKDKIFSIRSDDNFNALALEIFRYQYENNKVYHEFVSALKVNPEKIKRYADIPFLPVGFFKSQVVFTGRQPGKYYFASSGTTGMTTSKHFYDELSMYERSYRETFRLFYGEISQYVILALLPSYLENKHSSLISMVNGLISESGDKKSGFYLNDPDILADELKNVERSGKKILLIGVSYALLDVIEQFRFDLKNTVIMETGGMKGRRKEMVREELHEKLKKGFGVGEIHSEYGMTELFSQAYSRGKGIYFAPPWMKILIRDTNDPLHSIGHEKTGGINVIDLANIHSCCFIATQDLGKSHPDGSFEVLGRFDDSDVRGCNLLIGS